MGRTVACMEEMRNAHNILGGKPEGKRPLGRHRHPGWILEKRGKVWSGCIWIRIGTCGRLL
jgi:hypothetical protein